ncbi:hypothetical protein AGRA3207_006082 [Actinomadura graeca]|uniref:H-type lectin domain-containing protein n=1 Tax=Actinomadura graeca TaxID=2750812 RepID=A0ABX8R0X1_9ACTN|nr:hypothetical protein [Actinomadura graeca]QXJ24705.1 hypothetical protein AGRA3207_006082 [Actinomadura graeca]
MGLPTVDASIETGAEDLAESTRAVFTGFAFFNTRGQVILNATSGAFTPSTRVVVSIVEVDANNVPFIGSARMTIHNVRPYQGGVHVWANIEWDSNLRVRATFQWES